MMYGKQEESMDRNHPICNHRTRFYPRNAWRYLMLLIPWVCDL